LYVLIESRNNHAPSMCGMHAKCVHWIAMQEADALARKLGGCHPRFYSITHTLNSSLCLGADKDNLQNCI